MKSGRGAPTTTTIVEAKAKQRRRWECQWNSIFDGDEEEENDSRNIRNRKTFIILTFVKMERKKLTLAQYNEDAKEEMNERPTQE